MYQDIKLDADYAICNPTFRESFNLEDVEQTTKRQEALNKEFDESMSKFGRLVVEEDLQEQLDTLIENQVNDELYERATK